MPERIGFHPEAFLFQTVYKGTFPVGVDNPVFLYSGIGVQVQLPDIVVAGAAGRNNFKILPI